MRKRPFGRAGFDVSELALGTWGLSGEAYGPVYHKEVDKVIDRAVEAGITLFETADVYGRGEMEKKLGERLKDAEGTRIVTKIGTVRPPEPEPQPVGPEDEPPPEPPEAGIQARKSFDPESLRVAFERSRERIGRDKLDVVLLHNPSAKTIHAGEATDFLKERVAAGELEAWGVSVGDWESASAAIQRGADVVQMAYNLLHPRDLHRITDELASTDTALLARSVLAHGLLAGVWSRTKKFFENDHRSKRWTAETLAYRMDQLDAVKSLVGGDVVTLRAAALRFVLSNGLVTSAVLGPRSVTQLNQLLRESGSESVDAESLEPAPAYLDDDALVELPMRLEAVGIEV
jgi:aryl-alcohol dehydrogenase-like predicted oxidoreductase